jgi:hypothetical protein
MKNIYPLIFFLLLLNNIGFVSENNLNDFFIEEKELVRNTISEFYNNYNGNFRKADTAYLSHNLKMAINKAIATETASALEVKASSYPSDKPKILEGEIFTGLYEGFTAFSVKEIIMLNDTLASSEIQFANNYYNEKWTDSIVLINENGWKIDNVYFTKLKHKPALSAAQLLDSFVVSN